MNDRTAHPDAATSLETMIRRRDSRAVGPTIEMLDGLLPYFNERHGMGLDGLWFGPDALALTPNGSSFALNQERVSHAKPERGVSDPWHAPEQKEGRGNARSDVWRVATMLYITLARAGSKAPEATALAELLRVRCAPPMRVYRDDIPEAVVEVLARATHPLPDRRPASLLCLVEELRAAMITPIITRGGTQLGLQVPVDFGTSVPPAPAPEPVPHPEPPTDRAPPRLVVKRIGAVGVAARMLFVMGVVCAITALTLAVTRFEGPSEAPSEKASSVTRVVLPPSQSVAVPELPVVPPPVAPARHRAHASVRRSGPPRASGTSSADAHSPGRSALATR